MTPPLVPNPGMETHIHPFEVKSIINNKSVGYLHTSPEFYMKDLLSRLKDKNLFTLGYCFRDEPNSPIHRNQFIMLEWYRKNVNYEKIMSDCHNLVLFCLEFLASQGFKTTLEAKKKCETRSVKELFLEFAKLDILEFQNTTDLKRKIQLDLKDIPLPFSDCAWDDYFFLIFLNLIEPNLTKFETLIIKEYPGQLAALSTLNKKDKRVCNRFEYYIRGLEIANCFEELTDLREQKKRFTFQAREKKSLYHYELPCPNILYNSLERGLPHSSGIALGVERLLSSLVKLDNPFFIS